MRRMLLTALAIATLVSSGILLQRAAVKAHAPAPVTDAKATDAGFFQLAANVCGPGGCVPVQVRRLDKHQIHKAITTTTAPPSLQQTLPPQLMRPSVLPGLPHTIS
jgi:hypothetical protein